MLPRRLRPFHVAFPYNDESISILFSIFHFLFFKPRKKKKKKESLPFSEAVASKPKAQVPLPHNPFNFLLPWNNFIIINNNNNNPHQFPLIFFPHFPILNPASASGSSFPYDFSSLFFSVSKWLHTSHFRPLISPIPSLNIAHATISLLSSLFPENPENPFHLLLISDGDGFWFVLFLQMVLLATLI